MNETGIPRTTSAAEPHRSRRRTALTTVALGAVLAAAVPGMASAAVVVHSDPG